MTKTKRTVLIGAIVAAAALAFTSCTATLPHTAQNFGPGLQNNQQGTLYNGQHTGQGLGQGQGLRQGITQALPEGTTAEAPEASANPSTITTTQGTASTIGSAGALSDSTPELSEMLTYALQDEYAARAEYDYVLKTFGNVRPFSNIIKAEETHIAELKPLFAAHGASLPADTGSEHVAKADSYAGALAAGIQAEKNNIAMYEAFLRQQMPSDVRAVFEELMKASQNHLAAFSRSHGR